MSVEDSKEGLSRRKFLGQSTALLAAAASMPIVAAAQQTADKSGDNHTGVNEQQPGPINKALDSSEPDSVYPPETDAGGSCLSNTRLATPTSESRPADGRARSRSVIYPSPKKWRAWRCA